MARAPADSRECTLNKALCDDDEAGRPLFMKYREEGARHPIEVVGAKLRPMMAWIDDVGE